MQQRKKKQRGRSQSTFLHITWVRYIWHERSCMFLYVFLFSKIFLLSLSKTHLSQALIKVRHTCLTSLWSGVKKPKYRARELDTIVLDFRTPTQCLRCTGSPSTMACLYIQLVHPNECINELQINKMLHRRKRLHKTKCKEAAVFYNSRPLGPGNADYRRLALLTPHPNFAQALWKL